MMTPKKPRTPRQGREARSPFANGRALLAAIDAMRDGRPIAFDDPDDRDIVRWALVCMYRGLAERDRRRRMATSLAELADYFMRRDGLGRKAAVLQVIDDHGKSDQRKFGRVAKALDRLRKKKPQRTLRR